MLLAPAGGQDHTSPRVAAHVAWLAERGWTPAVVRSLEAVPPLLAAHPGPVGLVGVGQGARLGLTLLAAEPRVRAAVLALPPELSDAPPPQAPVRFLDGGGLVDPDDLATASAWLLDRITPVVVLPGGPLLPPAYLGDLGGLGLERDLVPADLPTDRCDRLVPHVEALREELGVDRLTLLAHSAGASVALRYAEHHPERVTRLVLVTPSVKSVGITTTLADRAAVGRGPVDDLPARHLLYGRWDDAAQAHAAALEASRDPAAAVFAAPGAFDPPATRAALAALEAPVRVVAGGLDVSNPPEVVARLAALCRHGEVVVQDGAGHFPWVDDPERFRALVGL